MTTREDAVLALTKLFVGFHPGGTDKERAFKMEVYWEVLGELEPEVVVRLCERAMRGEIGDGRFLPTVAEMYRAAPWPPDAPKPIALPEPPRVDQETRDRCIASWHEARKGFSSPLVEYGKPRAEYDPTAASFSPYDLGATFEQIERSNRHFI